VIDWGSVADWVSAVATVAALLAAAYAARAAFRQLGVLEQQERDRREAHDIRDAARVAVWARIDVERGLPELRYINASGMPVHDLTLWVVTPEKTFEMHYVVDGPSAESKTMKRGTDELRRQIEISAYRPDWTRLLESGGLLCAAAFRDSANRAWLRDFHGLLTRVDDLRRVRARVDADVAARFPR
jgi:hypothetical protein